MFANLLSFFFNHKNAQPLFFLHLSTSGTVNNIKIIYSIRFSLLITINRFYKLFLAEGAFVNRRPETIPPLFFIPTEPYPARFARHLPHAGKALSVVILFPKYTCIRFDDMGIAVSSYRSLPHLGRGTAQRWIGYSRKRRT